MNLDDCRRFYAEELRWVAGINSPALVEAFARVPREKFLGPSPWQIWSGDPGLNPGASAYLATDDARDLYHNVLVALDAARRLNNGQPGALARWIGLLDLKPGARAFHLGCGVGYYTAVMAEVVGAGGHVLACEVDPELAARAKANLAGYTGVEVVAEDGAVADPGMCDAMLINAGVTHPLRAWLDRLNEGGRLVVPITMGMPGTPLGQGVMVKITRRGNSFAAQAETYVAIYSCTSARDPQLDPVIGQALGTRAFARLKSARCDEHATGDACLVHGGEVCLSSAEPV